MNTKEILKSNNFVFKKKYGQNFLLDHNILDNMLKQVSVSKNDLVIEVGVGAGALTKKLAKKAKIVLGYEIDVTLKNSLNEILKDDDNVTIIYEDFLKRDVKKDVSNFTYDNLYVISNLPYYITTPIITKFIDEKIDVTKIIVMVQKEVADRFAAKTGTKAYNSLTVFLNYYFDIKKEFVVSKNVFYPKPNVDSAVVSFKKKTNLITLKDDSFFFKLVKDAFVQKRKTLKNNLRNYDLEKINKIMSGFNKNVNYRAENISIEEFALIANGYV